MQHGLYWVAPCWAGSLRLLADIACAFAGLVAHTMFAGAIASLLRGRFAGEENAVFAVHTFPTPAIKFAVYLQAHIAGPPNLTMPYADKYFAVREVFMAH